MSWAGAAGKRNAGCHCLIGRRLGGYLLADTYHKLHFLHLHSICCSWLSAGKRRVGWGAPSPFPCSPLLSCPSPTSTPREPPRSCQSHQSHLSICLTQLGHTNFPKEAVRLHIDALHCCGSSNQALGFCQGPQSSTVALQPPIQDTSLLQDHLKQHTKDPTRRLDTQPITTRYQIPTKSIAKASRCIPA